MDFKSKEQLSEAISNTLKDLEDLKKIRKKEENDEIIEFEPRRKNYYYYISASIVFIGGCTILSKFLRK